MTSEVRPWWRGASWRWRGRVRPRAGVFSRARFTLTDGADVLQEAVEVGGGGSRLVRVGDADDGIDAAQQDVDGLAGEGDLAVLGGDQAILHDMGHPDAVLDADNAGGALDGVCGAHQRLDDTELAWFLFEGEQALVQGLGMALDLGPEQLEHGVVAEVLGVAQGHVGTMVRRRRVGS